MYTFDTDKAALKDAIPAKTNDDMAEEAKLVFTSATKLFKELMELDGEHYLFKLIDCKDDIIDIFNEQATEIQEDGLDYFNRPDSGWIKPCWANDNVRRAPVDVVDARDTKGLWMMHVCIFPTLDNP